MVDKGPAAEPGQGVAEGGVEDRTLVERLRAGDEAAFAKLVESLTPMMLRIARLNGPAATAEDTVQETWLAVIRGLDRFAGRSSLRTWIVGILLNIARTRARRERRHVPYAADVSWEDRPAAVEDWRFRPPGDDWEGHWVSYPTRWDEVPDEAWLSKEATAEIHAAIASLPPPQREVVTLRDVLGWTSAEAMAALGLSAVNQRVLLHRGRSRLRAALESYAERAAGPARVTPAGTSR